VDSRLRGNDGKAGTRRPRTLTARVVIAALAAVLTPPAAGAPNDAALQRGLQLYAGAAPLQGTITGHAAPLPPAATRCINCHALGAAGPARAASAPGSFGPLLTRERLTQRVARRGGPPSAYDEAAFCRLLRTGIDPAYVLIPRDMPRYALADADCRGLWLYLTTLP
jgi:hypothetical protein